MTLQSQVRTQFASSHCFLYNPAKLKAFQFSSANSIGKVCLLSIIPTHHIIRVFIFIKIFLENHCISLYNKVRFYERLGFKNKKRIAFIEEKEIMTVKEVVEYLQMNEHNIYKLARSALFLSIKTAGQWKFKKEIRDKRIIEESLVSVKKNLKNEKR